MRTFIEETTERAVDLISPNSSQFDRESVESLLFVLFSVAAERGRAQGENGALELLRAAWRSEPSVAASVLAAWLATGEPIPSWVDDTVSGAQAIATHLAPEALAAWRTHENPTPAAWLDLAFQHVCSPFPCPVSRQLKQLDVAIAGLRIAIECAEPKIMKPILQGWCEELESADALNAEILPLRTKPEVK